MYKNIYFLFTVLLSLNSCGLFKKTGEKPTNMFSITIDTISIAANDDALIYRASETRINDIIHTRLDVKFDWEKAYLYGKATVTVKPYFYSTTHLDLDAKGF